MRQRLSLLPILIATVLAVLAAACGEGGGDQATATRAPAAHVSPAATATAAGTAAAGAQQLEVTARGIAFDKASLQVAASQPFTIRLKNDAQVTHNLHIYTKKDGDSIAVTQPDRVPAGSTGVLSATIAQAGDYYFQCDIHPSAMTGKITVGAAQSRLPAGSSTQTGSSSGY